MATSFFGGAFFNGEFFNSGSAQPVKNGVGGIEERFIVKPTGILHRPKKGKQSPVVEERIGEAHEAAVEAKKKVEEEFNPEKYLGPVLTAQQRDQEIARLIHLRIRTEEEDILLMMLMAAAC